MGLVLTDAGLGEVSVMTPENSSFEGWNSFGLDLEEDGRSTNPVHYIWKDRNSDGE